MKISKILIVAVLAATAAAQAATTEQKFPAPLPAFKTPEQLAKWRQEMAEKANAADVQANTAPTGGSSVFYTGKPYVTEVGSYAFKYRTYDPALSRWTSVDPSGFPDGVNNQIYINNQLNMIEEIISDSEIASFSNKHLLNSAQ